MVEVKKKKVEKKNISTIKYENTRIYLISFLDLKNFMSKTIMNKFTKKNRPPMEMWCYCCGYNYHKLT
jgi:hypothetical protein